MNTREPRVWARRDRTAVTPAVRVFARQMRREPTDAERKLWWHLRHRIELKDSHFRRQVRFGKYIVDFASHAARMIIEVDGGQHELRSGADAQRTEFLERRGYRVLRYWNNDVMRNIDGVIEHIQSELTTTPTPSPSPQGGGEPRRARGERM